MIKVKSICLDASTICQLKCPSCPTANGITTRVLGKGFLKFADFKNIVEKNPQLYSIELSNWGDIFLNPELEDIIKYSYYKGIELTADNGVNLNNVADKVLESMVKYKFRRIKCSIDGASQRTYSVYRVKGDFDQVIRNIETINRFKKQYASIFPIIKWQYVPFGHNEQEISKAIKKAAELDMLFEIKLSWDDLYDRPFSPIKDPSLIMDLTAKTVSSRREYSDKYGRDYVSKCCLSLWYKPRINYDGRLLGCSINYWSDYGNVYKEGLTECFNGQKINYAREMLLGKKKELSDIPCSCCKIYRNKKEKNNWFNSEDIKYTSNLYNKNRKYIIMENRIFSFRLINKFVHIFRMSDKKTTGRIKSSVYNLRIPLDISSDEKFKPFSIFKGITGGWLEATCHVSVLKKDCSPHDPHRHIEEEVLLLLSGKVNIKIPESSEIVSGNMDLKEGDFVYYPAYFPHTIETISQRPANYLMIKWKNDANNKRTGLNFNYFNIGENKVKIKSSKLSSMVVFEGPTKYLKKLHCHLSSLEPKYGYKPHSDIYDVIIIVLEGEIETLGQKAKPYDVIFYSAGEPHGIFNPGIIEAKYIVFELHSDQISVKKKISYYSNNYFRKLTNLKLWKRKLKKIFRI